MPTVYTIIIYKKRKDNLFSSNYYDPTHTFYFFMDQANDTYLSGDGKTRYKIGIMRMVAHEVGHIRIHATDDDPGADTEQPVIDRYENPTMDELGDHHHRLNHDDKKKADMDTNPGSEFGFNFSDLGIPINDPIIRRLD